MDDENALLISLIAIIGFLVIIIVIFGVCCYLRRKRRRYESIPLSETSGLLRTLSRPRQEQIQLQEQTALLTCHFYIRTQGDYTFHSQLSQLGSDPEKCWFLITPIPKASTVSVSTGSHLLTIQPKSDALGHLNDETSTATYSRTLNNLFSRLYHPYVEPIVRIDVLHTQKSVVIVKKFQRLGSLKDILHGSTPTATFHVKHVPV